MLRLILGVCPAAFRKDQYHIFHGCSDEIYAGLQLEQQQSLLWAAFAQEELVNSPLLQAPSVPSQLGDCDSWDMLQGLPGHCWIILQQLQHTNNLALLGV